MRQAIERAEQSRAYILQVKEKHKRHEDDVRKEIDEKEKSIKVKED